MHEDFESHAWRIHTEHRFGEDQMSRAGNGEKLGQPLHEAKDYGLE